MKYFLDTEFIERPGSIQLISIGIVADDSRTFYAESTGFDERNADKWVRENVLDKLRWWGRNTGSSDLLHNEVSKYDNKVEVFGTTSFIKRWLLEFLHYGDPSPEFWGYFADYDWVIFCWIFGKMIDLPKGFPKYCNDIKQLMVEHGITKKVYQSPHVEHNALEDAIWNKLQYVLVNSLISKNRSVLNEIQLREMHESTAK